MDKWTVENVTVLQKYRSLDGDKIIQIKYWLEDDELEGMAYRRMREVPLDYKPESFAPVIKLPMVSVIEAQIDGLIMLCNMNDE